MTIDHICGTFSTKLGLQLSELFPEHDNNLVTMKFFDLNKHKTRWAFQEDNGSQSAIQDFPLGGGRRSPMWALFGGNVCEIERIGSRWGGERPYIRQWLW